MKRHIIVHPDFLYIKEFIDRIPEFFETEGEVLYKSRNTIKIFATGDLRLNVKRYRMPSFINRIVYSFFKRTKADKAFYNSNEVITKGFETPASVAFIEDYSYKLLGYSYYVSLQIDDAEEIRNYYYGPLSGNEKLYSAFARYSAQLHKNGIYHLDYSPGNVLINTTDNSFNFILVDINRMKFMKVSPKLGCRNFRRMFGNDDVYKFIAAEYASETGIDRDFCEKWILRYKNRFLRYSAGKKAFKKMLKSI
ncbi:MAG: lipopolysaccharide kinase InaA family protein [Culturomica sp.]|jgi:serine/threonine protein kinase|nr:lipopolysaccharide kinase InaA family protein [Culturomica sp.]